MPYSCWRCCRYTCAGHGPRGCAVNRPGTCGPGRMLRLCGPGWTMGRTSRAVQMAEQAATPLGVDAVVDGLARDLQTARQYTRICEELPL
jgi:hypothetical protein